MSTTEFLAEESNYEGEDSPDDETEDVETYSDDERKEDCDNSQWGNARDAENKKYSCD